MFKSLNSLAFLAPFVLGLGLSTAQAMEISAAPGMPPGNATAYPYKVLQELLPKMTDGKLTVREIGMEVVNLKNSVDSLQNGITDIAHVLTLYLPANFSNSVFVSELAALGKNGTVMQAAMTEYMVNCGECMEEFKKLGLVYTGHVATRPYNILSVKPVRSVADLKGMRLRSGGSPFSRWATAMGANPVQMSANDQYEALSNGLLDGTMNPLSALFGGRLEEVVKYVTDMPIGTFHAAMPFTLRKDTWNKLSTDERKALLHAGAIALSSYLPEDQRQIDAGLGKAKANGLQFLEPDQGLVDANEAFAKSEIGTVAGIGRDRYHIKDPEKKIAQFQDLIAKYTRIFKERGYDAKTVGDILNEEVWSKVDLSTYGQ